MAWISSMRPLIYFTVTWWIVRICGEGGVEALSNGLWGGGREREWGRYDGKE